MNLEVGEVGENTSTRSPSTIHASRSFRTPVLGANWDPSPGIQEKIIEFCELCGRYHNPGHVQTRGRQKGGNLCTTHLQCHGNLEREIQGQEGGDGGFFSVTLQRVSL